MIDDIVTRLRESTTNEYFITDRVMLEAADEIESLRATIQWFQHISVCRKYGREECWDCVTPENRKTIMEELKELGEQNGDVWHDCSHCQGHERN